MSKDYSALVVKVHHEEIDTIHARLDELVSELAHASDEVFSLGFTTLIEHTESHFSREEQLMHDSDFPHAAEHIAEHRQMLQEMKLFGQRRLTLARAYVTQRLPERFNLHITRMDSLLASHLNGTNVNL